MIQSQQLTYKEIITNFLDDLSDEVKSEIKNLDNIIEILSHWVILKMGNNQMILCNDMHETTLQITSDGQLQINIREKQPKQVRLAKNARNN